VLFNFTGGINAYGDGRLAAWYFVSDVTYNAAAPIPEPETYAMLLCGVGLLGWQARRRKHGRVKTALRTQQMPSTDKGRL